METIKINFVMYSTGRTGGTRTLLNYVKELANLGHEVTITSMYYSHWFDLPESVTIISKNTKFSLYLFYAKSLYARKVGKTNIDYHITILKKLYHMSPKSDINVATFFPTAYVASWLKEKSVPFYTLMHMPEYFAADEIEKQFFYDTLFLKLHSTVNSSWLQNRVFEETGLKFPMINMGATDTKIFYPLIKPLDKKNGNIDIVALGKGGFKNSMGIFESIQKVRREIPYRKIKLHYFGSKPPKGIAFDGSLNFFHRNLSDEDLAELYRKSDIQVTFSNAESFPLPPLEAMACGCPVITTPYGVEDYVVDGENAIIVQPGNKDILAAKIRMLVEDKGLREKLANNGVKTAKRFDYHSQTKMLEAEMKKAMYQNATRD